MLASFVLLSSAGCLFFPCRCMDVSFPRFTFVLICIENVSTVFSCLIYHNYLMYWDRQACANSVDPDQTPQNAVSDQGLNCLPQIHHFVWIDKKEDETNTCSSHFRRGIVRSYHLPIFWVCAFIVVSSCLSLKHAYTALLTLTIGSP